MHMFTRFFRSKIEVDVENAVAKVVERKLGETLDAFRGVEKLTQERASLRDQLAGLKNEKAHIAEEMEREREKVKRERLDIDHKLGLDKMRIEQEADLSQRSLDAEREQMKAANEVAVQSAILKAQSEAAEEARNQMKELMDRQEEMIGKLLDAQPDHRIREKRGA